MVRQSPIRLYHPQYSSVVLASASNENLGPVGKTFKTRKVKLPQDLAPLVIVESELPSDVFVMVKRSVIPIVNLTHSFVGHFRMDFPDRFPELKGRQVVIVDEVDRVSHVDLSLRKMALRARVASNRKSWECESEALAVLKLSSS